MRDIRWKRYVPAAERRRKSAAAIKARRAGAALSPIAPSRGAIARTFWGKAWCDNLEHYSDYANRLPRGRTYLRNGSVIDLVIAPGEVRAQVMGSSLYRIDVRVAAVADAKWRAIGRDCAGSIDSMVELLQGKFSNAVMQRLCRPGDGLFPTPKEIEFTCSCPDWASMCKHVAAVLYGVGARLDQQPQLLFDLRRVDGRDLLAQAGTGLASPRKVSRSTRVLDESALSEVFGIEMADVAVAPKSTAKSARPGRKMASGTARATSRSRSQMARPADHPSPPMATGMSVTSALGSRAPAPSRRKPKRKARA